VLNLHLLHLEIFMLALLYLSMLLPWSLLLDDRSGRHGCLGSSIPLSCFMYEYASFGLPFQVIYILRKTRSCTWFTKFMTMLAVHSTISTGYCVRPAPKSRMLRIDDRASVSSTQFHGRLSK
jgi:hypothetical protein